MVMRLAAALEDEGLTVERPGNLIERRGGIQNAVVDVVLFVAVPAAKGAIAATAGALLRPKIDRAIERFKERQPTARIEVDDGSDA